jgi:putative transposase
MTKSAENRRRSIRLKNWDYSREGAYFITVCTQNQKYLFGEISHYSMQLNPPGTIVVEVWDRLPERFPFMQLDARVLMPNHFHAIVSINRRGESCIRPSYTQLGQGEPKVRPYWENRPGGTAEGSIGHIVQALNLLPPANTSRASENTAGRLLLGNYGNATITNTSCETMRNGNASATTLPLTP